MPPARQSAKTPRRWTIIEPPRLWDGLRLRECGEYGELLGALALRDIRLRYRQTGLGILWVLLQPLLGAGLLSFVFGTVARMNSGGAPYFVFSYAGLLCWMAFANTVSKASVVLVQNAPVLTKVYFPRVLLPVSALLSSLLDFAVMLVVMLLLLAVAKVWPGAAILLLPVWLLLLLALAMGLGLIGGALSARYRDVPFVTPVLIQFLTTATPVAYRMDAVPAAYRHWLWLNPLAAPMEACRWSLLGTGALNADALAYSCAVAAALLAMGLWIFNWMENSFADVI